MYKAMTHDTVRELKENEVATVSRRDISGTGCFSNSMYHRRSKYRSLENYVFCVGDTN